MDRPVRWWVIMLIGGVGGGRRAREHTRTMARRADAAFQSAVALLARDWGRNRGTRLPWDPWERRTVLGIQRG